MASKERELEELIDIIHRGRHFRKESSQKIGEEIQQEGYTKQPFDIEELVVWVTKQCDYWQNMKKEDKIAESLSNMIITSMQAVLDKIREIEGKGC